MSSKPARPGKPAASPAASVEVLEHTAQVHLEKGRHRDAVDAYKTLLKTERRPQWLAGLANAYAGRAQGLATKGMVQEAIALWRSRAELSGAPLWEGPFVGWLLSAGRLADVLGHLSARRATGGAAPDVKLSEEITTLEAKIAPAILSADAASLARLPGESLLVRHRPFALAALAAYARKDVAALDDALGGISFRSPYRDLRILLKAMVLWETDPELARTAIARVPQDGPFESLVAPLRTVLVPGAGRWRVWTGLRSAQQALVLDLLGCPQAFAPLLRDLGAADAALAPAALFDLLQRHARDLPEPVATRAWQWLAPWAKRRGCDSPRIFGRPTEAAKECATALAVELTGDLGHAETHWVDAADQLVARGGPDDPLRAALVLRRAALATEHLSSEGTLDTGGAAFLTRSLLHDPLDCDSHVRLVAFWRRDGNLKNAREQLDFGLAYFPGDVALLTEAVATALAAGAFKKAATTARRLLELDPLNRKVRSLVGHAHLSHAAKQIAADKLEAAKKEIEEAGSWLGASVDQGRMLLLQAWTEPAGHAERLRLAQLAVSTWGGGLAAGWRLVREAQRTFANVGLTSSVWLLGEGGIESEKVLTSVGLSDLAQLLEQEAHVVQKGSDPLVPWRKGIARMAAEPVFDLQETIRICEAFSRHEEHHLLEVFANAARKRWPQQPIFVYHAVAARFATDECIASERDYDDLEQAQERAHQNKDFRLSMRIDALFEDDAPEPGFETSGFANPSSLPGLPGASFDMATMTPEVFRVMLEQTIQLDGGTTFLKQARKDLGDAVYRQIEKECTGKRALFLSRLLDLVCATIGASIGRPPPKPAPRIVKPSTPVEEQGTLFDE